jgi:lactate dehydrogenase-like 2-hydroxyacid dehydrogenase
MVPHIGSSTLEARVGMGQILINALSDWQAGLAVANRVC